MSCALTTGFSPECLSGPGGIVEFKVKAFPITEGDFTLNANGTVTIASGSETGWYKYELDTERGEYASKATGLENLAQAYEHELKFSMANLSKEKETELHLLAKNRLLVAIKTNEGKCWMFGFFNGARVIANESKTGKAMADAHGYDVTIKATSRYHKYDCTAEYANLVTT